jgi:hypothetical protein
MPQYVIFFIVQDRPDANDSDDNKSRREEPAFRKVLHDFLGWIAAEIKAERIKSGNFLLESSEETNIQVNFHLPEDAPVAEPEKNDEELVIPSAESTVTRDIQLSVSRNILGYYTGEFPALGDVIEWARSCPIGYDRFTLEIRQLYDAQANITEAPSEARDWAADHIVEKRKEQIEQGNMKKDEDGTLWAKVEDPEPIKQIVAEAETRQEQNEHK